MWFEGTSTPRFSSLTNTESKHGRLSTETMAKWEGVFVWGRKTLNAEPRTSVANRHALVWMKSDPTTLI